MNRTLTVYGSIFDPYVNLRAIRIPAYLDGGGIYRVQPAPKKGRGYARTPSNMGGPSLLA